MYSVCNRTWFITSNCPHFTHFILFQMTLNLIRIPYSGTSPAFGKGPSQSDSPRNSNSHWVGAGFLVFGYTCTFYQFPPLLCSSFSSAWGWAVEPTPAWSSTLLSSQANKLSKEHSSEHLSCNTNQCYWASWMHFSKTTSSNRIHHKTRKEMEEDWPDSAKCSSRGSSGKPWRFIFLQLLP